MPPTIDFAIVTALRVERDAVLQRMENMVRHEKPGDPYVYFRGQMEIADSTDKYEVVLTQLLEPGNVSSGVETASLLAQWNAAYVLMVGIAGGFTEQKVNLGDVLVPKYVHYYEPGKVMPEGEERRFRQYDVDRILWAKAMHYEEADWKSRIGANCPTGIEDHNPNVHFEPVGCGETVVAAMARIKELLAECPKMVGVAMEAAGVAIAVANAGKNFLEIRGVSDAADVAKDDAWHPYAANVAASFLAGFLKSHPVVPVQELARRATAQGEKPKIPLAIVRAQSLRPISSTELIDFLPDDLRQRELETIELDFTSNIASDGKFIDPESAIAQLASTTSLLSEVLARRNEVDLVFHGLVHIPLATFAGFVTSDRQIVRLFDFHPDSGNGGSWKWPVEGDDQASPLRVSRNWTEPAGYMGDVSVRISVSYRADDEASRSAVPETEMQVDMSVETPVRGIVKSEAQSRTYAREFRAVLDRITSDFPRCGRVHVFYAGPVSLAFLLGQQISENIHPHVVVWNYRREEGYAWGIDLMLARRGEPCVLYSR